MESWSPDMARTKKKNGVDYLVGWTLVMAPIVVQAIALCGSIGDMFKHTSGLTAISVVKVCNDMAGLMIPVCVFVVWHTVTTRSDSMRQWQKYKFGGIFPNGTMRGGFVPVPAAMAVGALLFVTGNFVAEEYTRGGFLVPAANAWNKWFAGKRCRWTSTERNDWQTYWGARFEREAPATPFTRDLGKILGGDVGGGIKALEQDAKDPDLQSDGLCYMGKHGNWLAPADFDSTEVNDASCTAGPKCDPLVPNIVHPIGREDMHCFYQCSYFIAVNLPGLVGSVGSITVGAGIVVVLTDQLSAKVGPKLITPATTPNELLTAFKKTNPTKFPSNLPKLFKQSYTFAALPFLFVYFFYKSFLVAKINADGGFTVDYYVTFSMLFSATLAVILRYYNPYRGTVQLFTGKIWKEGTDSFVVTARTWRYLIGESSIDEWGGWTRKPPITDEEKKAVKAGEQGWPKPKTKKDEGKTGTDVAILELDLAQWMHLTRDQACALCIDYARRPTSDLSAPGALLKNLQHNTCIQVVECSGSWHETKIPVPVMLGSSLELVYWLEHEMAVVRIKREGDKDTPLKDNDPMKQYEGKCVAIMGMEMIEDSSEWTEMIKTAEGDDYKVFQSDKWASFEEPLLNWGGKA